MTMNANITLSRLAAVLLCLAAPPCVLGHGDVSPQPIDVSDLEPLGGEWLDANPYSVADERVVEVGASAYNQNCARCHGLGAKSGGIAPDLRLLPADAEGDFWYIDRTRHGAIRNGITYMPGFEGILAQEALWAIRTWLVKVTAEHAAECESGVSGSCL